jgi:hypothetical protein
MRKNREVKCGGDHAGRTLANYRIQLAQPSGANAAVFYRLSRPFAHSGTIMEERDGIADPPKHLST